MIYIAPDPEAHGHRVLRENGALAVAPYFIAKAEEPITEGAWIALLAEQDRDAQALDVRRRIRSKVTVKRMKMLPNAIEKWEAEEMDEWMEEEEKERRVHRHRVESIMEQEAVLMLGDDQQSMHATYEELRRLKQAKPAAEEEEDVLRTRIVSVQEMVLEKEKWHDAITGEMKQLFDEKGALLRLSDEEFAALKKKQGAAMEVIPMKAVLTKKPGPRRRFRMVACGNYIEKGGKEEVYASGADALTVRFALKKEAEMGWKGLALDIKVAFLNAPLRDDEDHGDEAEVILKPPSLLVRLGYARPGEHYLAVKAVYGLRQSPRKWGRQRSKAPSDEDQRGLRLQTVHGGAQLMEGAEGSAGDRPNGGGGVRERALRPLGDIRGRHHDLEHGGHCAVHPRHLTDRVGDIYTRVARREAGEVSWDGDLRARSGLSRKPDVLHLGQG